VADSSYGVGVKGAVSVGGATIRLNKITCKAEQEKIEFVAFETNNGWKDTIWGGPKVLTGSFEGACYGGLPGIFKTDGSAAFSIAVDGGGSISFNAVILDVELDKSSTGLVTIKGSYQSTGEVTCTL
jgi:hypothetical protein